MKALIEVKGSRVSARICEQAGQAVKMIGEKMIADTQAVAELGSKFNAESQQLARLNVYYPGRLDCWKQLRCGI